MAQAWYECVHCVNVCMCRSKSLHGMTCVENVGVCKVLKRQICSIHKQKNQCESDHTFTRGLGNGFVSWDISKRTCTARETTDLHLGHLRCIPGHLGRLTRQPNTTDLHLGHLARNQGNNRPSPGTFKMYTRTPGTSNMSTKHNRPSLGMSSTKPGKQQTFTWDI